ncbi:MAG TPA: hypothetical protein IAA98_03715 [Candidatus Avipropionibacterium avicola]|uniref:Uncharacterized protein n=1 Tax=Candidatus Avipropionibacterium avicola TaxID=2840701 RepID=A0A9D1KLR1_9ACTN|nr:hypothetical protein [Candidatus Avipropionibacterium avicola]
MTGTSAEELQELGERLSTAKTMLTGLYDRLSLDYGSVAAIRYHFTRDGLGGEAEDMRDNSRTMTWHVVPGDDLAGYDESGTNVVGAGMRVHSASHEQQPAAVASAELLEQTRDETETLSQLTGDDLDALASIPTVLGYSNEKLADIRDILEDDINAIVELQNSVVNGSDWTGIGRDAYYNSLQPQHAAFTEAQDNVNNLIEANVALAQMTADLFSAFVEIREAQWEGLQEIGGVIFSLANPTNWLSHAQKVFDKAVEIKAGHIQEFQDELDELANSAERRAVIEKAEATASMEWPEAPEGITGDWSH